MKSLTTKINETVNMIDAIAIDAIDSDEYIQDTFYIEKI